MVDRKALVKYLEQMGRNVELNRYPRDGILKCNPDFLDGQNAVINKLIKQLKSGDFEATEIEMQSDITKTTVFQEKAI